MFFDSSISRFLAAFVGSVFVSSLCVTAAVGGAIIA